MVYGEDVPGLVLMSVAVVLNEIASGVPLRIELALQVVRVGSEGNA
jgi:hypothetical protein